MHGLIFAELKKYVVTKFGSEAWSSLIKHSGLGPKVYLPVQSYADEEAVALVSSASNLTGKSVAVILEDFGQFIAPDLIQMYNHLIDPAWKTLDLIEHTEGTIHHVVRIREKDAKPPDLKSSRPSPNEVILKYDSPRQMCALAVGIMRGIAKHYDERITVTEISCMLKGDACCEIAVRLEG